MAAEGSGSSPSCSGGPCLNSNPLACCADCNMLLCSAALPVEQREVNLTLWSRVDAAPEYGAAACADLPVL